MRSPKEYDATESTWCPGCGDFAVLAALKRAAAEMEIDPEELVVLGGIGCSSKLNEYIKCYGYHGVHGRAVPVATGIKLANPRLTVVVAGGDGDGYAIGVGHFVHACRRNPDLVYIVMNNQVYGLTKGQASPTSDPGFVTGTSPEGVVDTPVDGLALALVSGASFVARGFSGNVKHLVQLYKAAIEHKGFALIDVLSPCVTYNKVNTYDWLRENIEYVDEDPNYDPTDRKAALARLMESEKIPLGLIFRQERPSLEQSLLKDGRAPIGRELAVDGRYEKLQEVFV